MSVSPGVRFLADAHAVDQGDEQRYEPEHQDHYSNIPINADLHYIFKISFLKLSFNFYFFVHFKYSCMNAVFRIRSDPYHLPGSGSASGNVDLDPGTKKNRDKLAYKSTKIIKI